MKSKLRLLATLLALALPLTPGAAAASPDKDKDADFDEDLERHSAFWESALVPDKDLYEALVSRAAKFIDRSDVQSRRETKRLLDQAIKIAPKQPAAWWQLGSLYDRQKKWQKCADARLRVYRLDPKFKPPRYVRNESSLDFALGRCLLHAEKYEQALEHLKHLQSRGRAYYDSYLRMGDAYMALGRLREALAAFQVAKRMRSWDAMVQYALAVAYDRDEQLSKSRDHLKQALRRDGSLTRLDNSRALRAHTEWYYYRALAHGGKQQPERALIRFREFLRNEPTSPWRRRAQQHVQELTRLPLTTRRLTLRGTTTLDRPRTVAAVAKISSALQACVAKLPGVLFRVELRALTPRRRRQKPEIAIKTRVEHSILGDDAAAKAEAKAALQCLDTVTRTVRLPRSKGSPGSYVRVAFPVIAQ